MPNRKKRKQDRKNKDRRSQRKRTKSVRTADALAGALSRLITRSWNNRDTSNYGKIVFTKERGCYDLIGGIALCSKCFYKNGCTKWYDERGY